MINHPVFPFADPKAYVETMSWKAIPVVGKAAALGHMLVTEPKEAETVHDIRKQDVANPLEITYWSGTPYWLGSAAGEQGHAVKYSAYSHQTGRTDTPDDSDENYLSKALARSLQSQEAVFDFKVQLQADPVAMPVEDVSADWDEKLSEPITVATLRIPPQKVDGSGDLALRCESTSFNPWHALAEHRPMGGMNRLRKVVYSASVAKRAEH